MAERPAWAAALKVIMRIALLAGALAATLVYSVSFAADSSILTYHGGLARAGGYVMPGLTYERARGLRPHPSFDAAYSGDVYAQPLLWRDPGTGVGVLIVATEEDKVYAFDDKSGAQVWMRTLGEPAPPAGFHCGDIWPLGVTRHAGHRQAERDALSRRCGHARRPAPARDPCAVARRRSGEARLAGRRRDGARRKIRSFGAE